MVTATGFTRTLGAQGALETVGEAPALRRENGWKLYGAASSLTE